MHKNIYVGTYKTVIILLKKHLKNECLHVILVLSIRDGLNWHANGRFVRGVVSSVFRPTGDGRT